MEKRYRFALQWLIFIVVGISIRVKCHDESEIPADKGSVEAWFQENLKSTSLNHILQTAEKNPKVIKVGPGGHFKTITEALASVPAGNTQRININIAKGVYNEKIKVERTKPFITFYGEPGTIIQAGGTAKQFGTFASATVIVQSDYFMAYNIIFRNTAPMPTREDAASQSNAAAQALAFRIGGDYAAFYNCKFYGYQDTICDEKGRHLFKNCYVEGTVDFIFGSGKTLYLLSEIHVLKNDWNTVITAQGKQEPNEDSGFSFVHCTVTGDIPVWTDLGRAWMNMPQVVFSYCTMNDAIYSVAWDPFGKEPKNFLFGEYKNTGPGSNFQGRAPFAKQLDHAGAKRFLNLEYIQASKWLLPPNAGGSPMATDSGRPFFDLSGVQPPPISSPNVDVQPPTPTASPNTGVQPPTPTASLKQGRTWAWTGGAPAHSTTEEGASTEGGVTVQSTTEGGAPAQSPKQGRTWAWAGGAPSQSTTEGGAPTEGGVPAQSTTEGGAPTEGGAAAQSPKQGRTSAWIGGAPAQSITEGGAPAQSTTEGGAPTQSTIEGGAPAQSTKQGRTSAWIGGAPAQSPTEGGAKK